MAFDSSRRAVLAGAGTGLVALAGCVGGQDDGDDEDPYHYDDEEALIPPDDLLGDGWERVPEEEGEPTERAFEHGEEGGYLLVDVGVIEEDDLDEDETLDNAFDDLKSEVMVTGEEIDIEGTDVALYDEVDNLSVLAIRDANAVGVLFAGQMAGLSFAPNRQVALEAADALLAHWEENA